MPDDWADCVPSTDRGFPDLPALLPLGYGDYRRPVRDLPQENLKRLTVIKVKDLAVHAGTFSLIDAALEVPTGKYGILMGRTGSGKTTLLESICGLRSVDSGQVLLMGRDVTRLKPAERGIGFVPQDGALFPTMSVRDQIGFALTVRKWSRRQIRARVDELAQLLGIEPLLERYPQGLSGGERQRVALGRALAFRPDVLCLDEPLSALDESTRSDMCDLLKSVRRLTGVTTLHITHSRAEADILGDVVFWIHDGIVQNVEHHAAEPELRTPATLAPACSSTLGPHRQSTTDN